MKSATATLVMAVLACAAVRAAAGPVVLVAPLSNNTGQVRHEATAEGMTDALTALAAEAGVAVVDREHYQPILAEQELTYLGLTDRANALKLGRLLRAERLVTGGLSLEQPTESGEPALLHLTLQVWRIKDGRLTATLASAREPEQVLRLAVDAARELDNALEAKLPALDVVEIEEHPLADLHYLRGLGYEHAGHHDRALLAFFRAGDLDPLHERAVLHRARCYLALKEPEHAAVELRLFLERYAESSLIE